MDVFDLFAKISVDTSEYDKGLKSASERSEGFGSKVKSAFGTVAKLTGTALTASTGAIVAFGKSSVDTGMVFDSAMSQVAATMGTTTDAIGNLRDFAIDMGSKTAFSATEAAEALNYMALAGYDDAESMAALPNVLNLAAAGNFDLAQASDMVTDAQSALGLTMDETTVLVDQMAKASSKSNTSVAQLGDAILTVGGTARDMAGGTTELTAVLGVLADNGIKGAEGGTALRNVILSLGAPTDKAAKLLNAMNIEVYDAQGNLRPLPEIFGDLNGQLSTMTQGERTQVLNDIFNKVDLKSVNALMNTNVERWQELTTEIDNSRGAAEKMANTQLDNLAGDITLFKSALEGAQIIVSDQMTPTLREFVQFGTDGISTLSTAFQEGGLSGAMEALGTILSDGLNMVIEKLPEMVDAGMQLLGALGMGLLNNLPAITTAAVQIILTLVQGLITALPYIAQGAVQIISQLAVGIGQALPTLIPAAVQAVLTFLVGLTSPESLNSLINGALMLIQGLVVGIARALPLIVQSAGDIIANLINGLFDNGPKILEVGFQLLGELIKGLIMGLVQLPGALLKIGSALIGGIKDAISGAWDWITGKNKDSLDTIETDIDDTWGRTQSSTEQAWGGMQTQVGTSMSGMVGLTNTGTQDISSSISAGWGSSLLSTQQSWPGMEQQVDASMSGMVDLTSTGTQDISTSISSNWYQSLMSTQQNWPGMETQVDSSMANMVGLTDTGTGNIVSLFDQGWDNANISTEQGMGGILSTTDLLSGQAVTALDTNFGKMEGAVVDNLEDAKTAAGRVDFAPIGSAAIDGMSNAARDKASELANTMANAAMTAFNAAKAALQVNSPSKRGEWLWQMVMDGSVLGVDKNAYKLADAMEAASEGAVEAFNVNSKALDFGVFTPAPIDFSAYVEHYRPYDRASQGKTAAGPGNTTVNIYSPKAVDAVEAAREWKKTTQQLAMGF